MKYLAACLLLKLSGTDPSESKVKDVLTTAGVSYDADICKNVISKLDGVDVDQLMEKGRMKMSGVGAAPVAAAATSAPADVSNEGGKAEAAKEPEPESDDDLGFSLFD